MEKVGEPILPTLWSGFINLTKDVTTTKQWATGYHREVISSSHEEGSGEDIDQIPPTSIEGVIVHWT